MEITNEQLDHLTSFNAEATFYIGELEQLELTPVEYVFCSDLKATLGATIQFAKSKLYNDAQLFSAAMFSSHILLQCLRHDSQFYANYFNDIGEMRELYEVQKQELHGARILPLYLRDDMIAKNFRGE